MVDLRRAGTSRQVRGFLQHRVHLPDGFDKSSDQASSSLTFYAEGGGSWFAPSNIVPMETTFRTRGGAIRR